MLLIGPDPETERPESWQIHGQAKKCVCQWAKGGEMEARIQRLERIAHVLRQCERLTLWVAVGVVIAALIKVGNPQSWKPLLLCTLAVSTVYALLSIARSLVLVRLNDAKRRMAK